MRRLALIAAAGVVLAGCGEGHVSSPAPRQPHRLQYPVVNHSPFVRAVRPRPIIPCYCPYVVSPPPIVIRSQATLVSPTRLRIVTLGSSSCPSVPDELVAESSHTIRLDLTAGSRLDGKLVAHPPPGGVCTDDFGMTTMVVAIDPKEIDVHSPLTVRFFYKGRKKPEVRTAAPLKRYPVVFHSPVVLPIPSGQRGHLGIGSVKLVSPTRLGIVTIGSGSCPLVPDELTVLGPHKIRIHLTEGRFRNGRAVIFRGRFGCTADLRPTRMLLAIDPKLIDVHRPLTVVGLQRGSVTVAPLKS